MQVIEPLFKYVRRDIRYEILNNDCLSILRGIEKGNST
jgi:hypothetical protein